jgi:hypothetical protein
VEIGTRVRLIQDVDNYPTCLIRAGETGTLMRITLRHLLDQARPAPSRTRRVGLRTGNLGLVGGGSRISPGSIIGRKCRDGLASACPLARRTVEGESPGQARRALVNVGTRLCAPPWLEHRLFKRQSMTAC